MAVVCTIGNVSADKLMIPRHRADKSPMLSRNRPEMMTS